MFKRFSRMIIILTILLFGGVITTHASISDSNSQSGEETTRWNKQTIFHHYIKTFLGNWYNGSDSKKPSIKQPAKNKDNVERLSKSEPEKNTEQNQSSVNKESVNKSEPSTESEQISDLSQYEQEVVELTNRERTNAGLEPLNVDLELSRVAQEKSRDMAVNNYFDHNSPVYGSPFEMIQAYAINYRAAGENIAKGQRSPQEVVQAWMNSPGHRANILNGSFTHIGVGFVEQGNHWTQMFIGK